MNVPLIVSVMNCLVVGTTRRFQVITDELGT